MSCCTDEPEGCKPEAEMQDTGIPEPCTTQHRVEVVVVGGGFATLPLIRELHNSGTEFVVLDRGHPSIWNSLSEADLDFDLVSSLHSSYYSFEQLDHSYDSRFPLGSEYKRAHEKHFGQYSEYRRQRTVTCVVHRKDDASVFTEEGDEFIGRYVVMGLAFTRAIRGPLLTTDYAAIRDKTVLFNGFGDTSNLMLSRMIGANNRFLIVTDGFSHLQKNVLVDGKITDFSSFMSEPCDWFIPMCERWINQTTTFASGTGPDGRPVGFTRQEEKDRMPDPYSPFGANAAKKHRSNGQIVVKPWSIRTYAHEFKGKVGETIQSGVYLNDLDYFLYKGIVQYFRKSETFVDEKNKVLMTSKRAIQFDILMTTDYERPNLPRILIQKGKKTAEFIYRYRDHYMGCLPRLTPNIMLLGYTRPHFDGLCNMTEMQCLFAHQYISNAGWRKEVQATIEERIDLYNLAQYGTASKRSGHGDHLVMFAEYTRQMARVLQIPRFRPGLADLPLQLWINLTAPDHAAKFRQHGQYKLEGMAEYYKEYTKYHGYYIFQVLTLLRAAVLYKGMIVLAVHSTAMLLSGSYLASLLAVLLALQNYSGICIKLNKYNIGPVHKVPNQTKQLLLKEILPTLAPILLYVLSGSNVMAILAVCGVLYGVNRLGMRPSEELLDRAALYKELDQFYEEYCVTLNKVRGEKAGKNN